MGRIKEVTKVLNLTHIETAPKAIKEQLTIERDVLRRFGFRDDELRIVECENYKWQIVPANKEGDDGRFRKTV
jgi:hypothetical protein